MASPDVAELQASVEWLYKSQVGGSEVSPVKQLDALKGLLARSAAAGAVVLVLQPPMGLPCTAKVGFIRPTVDGVQIVSGGRVVYTLLWQTCRHLRFVADAAHIDRFFPHRAATMYCRDGLVDAFRRLLAPRDPVARTSTTSDASPADSPPLAPRGDPPTGAWSSASDDSSDGLRRVLRSDRRSSTV